jgi:hypothetical protein
MNTTPTGARRTGTASLAAGALLAVSVGAELLFHVQEPDGTVTRPALFAVYLTTWVAGSAALAVAAAGLRARAARAHPDGRAGRTTACAVIGAGLLTAFGVVALVTGLVQGAPLEAAFLLFALGLLLLVIGQVALARRLRRADAGDRTWYLPLVAAVALLVGVMVPTDPWHDIGLLASFGAWVAMGVRLLHQPQWQEAPRVPARQGAADELASGLS